ncbi:MAG: AmmeMemoRadiSam system radical SAM enzyme [Magnetococcales bacterium]|nr:AmmeMemoRadiSam system radical SAM enzyme [Magnetococcales bacterium]MBF0148919.1 AmmeMemoRadiSam system radical SAM enzyme [Magnetococcales bacterium]
MTTVVCELCPRYCAIPDGGAGDCRIRVNLKGRLIATTFGRPSSVHIDPMEKKPLYHFFPGTPIFSLATAGCNLHCLNCQNWQLSQRGGEEMEEIYHAPPEMIVATARAERCQSIAYTYSEPIVYYEYVHATAQLAREAGLNNCLISAGYINERPLRQLCRVMDAANIDVKGFTEDFYRRICSATLAPVLRGLVVMREEGVWVEVTLLVIPGENDDPLQVRGLARWIHDEMGADTPLHLSRFHPHYRMQNLPPTPVDTLLRCRQMALDAGLHFVYVGNVIGNGGESTYCPHDGTLLIERFGLVIKENHLLAGGRCPVCGNPLPGVWT